MTYAAVQVNVSCPTCRRPYARSSDPLDGFNVDRDRGEVTFGSSRIHLEPQEAQLLFLLRRRKGAVVRHEALLMVLDPMGDLDERSEVAKVYVCRLRKKLRDMKWPFTIRNYHGIGYSLERA